MSSALIASLLALLAPLLWSNADELAPVPASEDAVFGPFNGETFQTQDGRRLRIDVPGNPSTVTLTNDGPDVIYVMEIVAGGRGCVFKVHVGQTITFQTHGHFYITDIFNRQTASGRYCVR